MEVRVSRIISEYHEYTRKEAEELIREGRVKVNGALSGIGDKAGADDEVSLDDVMIPLKGLFRKFAREAAEQRTGERYGKGMQDDPSYLDNPKSKELRKGRKDHRKKRRGKNYEGEEY